MLRSLKAPFLAGLLLCACSCAPAQTPQSAQASQNTQTPQSAPAGQVVDIVLSDSGVTVDGQSAGTDTSGAVYLGGEIIYYHDGTDASYGEGETGEAHSADEAAAHTLVTISQPGSYRLSGTLSKGQIAIDLGDGAKDDPSAVVTLILDNANVTCTVAPALIFYNVYECDRGFVEQPQGYQPSAQVDTSAAGANVVLAAGSVNTFTGSHVARIYKAGTTENLHRYDGAFYSCMSMNISGDDGDDSGALNVIADNEGLDTQLHLTINGGTVNVQSQDDGVNTNEDNVSVTTINGGAVTVNAGQGAEGDGIDSNGYLVINGGSVTTLSSDRSMDGGIDADGDILVNGGALAAFGVSNDAVSKSSQQTVLELGLPAPLSEGSLLELKDGDGNVVWTATAQRAHQNLTVSVPELSQDQTYQLYVDGVLQETTQGFGRGGMRPGNGQRPPELPEDFDPSQFDGQTPPRDFDPEQFDGQTPPELPEDFDPSQFDGQRPHRGQAHAQDAGDAA